MNVGMLWFDNDRTSLEIKIGKAAVYYQRKYGKVPTTCQVHPSMLPNQQEQKLSGLSVEASRSILPGHLWIGVEEPKEPATVSP